jgi:hypothetical protein
MRYNDVVFCMTKVVEVRAKGTRERSAIIVAHEEFHNGMPHGVGSQ